MKQRDKQFRTGSVDESTTEPGRRDSHPGTTPKIPAREYENSEIAASSMGKPLVQSPQSDRRKTFKPPKAPKPKSVRKPQNPPSVPASTDGDPTVNASQINQIIGQNKDIIGQADLDNTYSVMGRDEESENTAQYSSVYTQKPPPSYVGDDMYDEVKM